MKRISITRSCLILTLLGTASSTFVAASSCSKSSGLTTYDKQVQANIDCVATVKVYFDEQPPSNFSFVNLVNKSDIKLQIVKNEKDFTPTSTVDVVNKSAIVTIALSEKQVINENIPYELQFTYVNNSGSVITKNIDDLHFKCVVRRDQLKDEVHIVDFNDLHGSIPGYGDQEYKTSATNPGVIRLMRDISPILELYPGSVLLAAGDSNSGNAFSNATHGQTLFPILKEMGVQYSAVGNHAFEWGLDFLAAERFDRWGRTSTTSGKYFIASNILSNPNYRTKTWVTDVNDPKFFEDYLIWHNQAVRWADPYKVINMKGHRICVIGLTTQETYNDGNQDVAKYLSFIDYNAAVHYAKYKLYSDYGKEYFDKIESFILLTHVESQPGATDSNPTGAAADLAANITTNIDGIISAHSHKALAGVVHNDKLNKNIWVGQAASHGKEFLDTKLVLDNNAKTGSKLSSISMTHNKVTIEYGGISPEEKEDKQKIAIRDAAAAKEYKELLTNPPYAKLNSVISEFNNQKSILDKQMSVKLAHSIEGAKYDTQGKNIGHEYIWFNNVVEQAGAWLSKAAILGFKHLFCTGTSPAVNIAPSMFFINQDSITHSWEPNHDVLLKDIFQLQGYENITYYGFLNIEQVAAIIDYMLAGQTKFDYTKKPKTKYEGELDICKQKNDKHLVDPNVVTLNVKEPTTPGVAHAPSAYLCGPLQFYGMRFEVEEATEEEKTASDRKWKLKWVTEDGITYPRIWFYDAVKPSTKDSNNFEKPNTWTSAKEYYKDPTEKYFPVILNNFTYDGMNESNRMFFRYMEYNASKIPSFKPLKFSQITRELMLEYCNYWQEITPKELEPKFDVTLEEVKQLVTGINN